MNLYTFLRLKEWQIDISLLIGNYEIQRIVRNFSQSFEKLYIMQQVDDYVNYVVSVPDGGQEEYRKDRSTRGIVTRSRQNKHLRARSFEDLFRNSRRGEASVKGQLAQTRSANTRLFSISGREHAWKVKQMIDGSTASSFPPILKIVQYLSIFATFQTRLSSIIPLLYTFLHSTIEIRMTSFNEQV